MIWNIAQFWKDSKFSNWRLLQEKVIITKVTKNGDILFSITKLTLTVAWLDTFLRKHALFSATTKYIYPY